MPIVISSMALLLIVRGLNLGIPYVSPRFEKQTNSVTCCNKSSEGKLDIHCSPKKQTNH